MTHNGCGEPVVDPFTVHVHAGPTHAENCNVVYEFEITAGHDLVYSVDTADVHGNPTEPNESEFELNVIGNSTEAGPHTFTVTQTSTGSLVGSTQYGFKVLPAAPDTASSTHNVADGTELVSAKDQLLELRVSPKDEFNNAITDATGYKVIIDGETHELFAPDFSFTHSVKAGHEGVIELGFTLDGVHIKNSPVKIKVEAPSNALSSGFIGVITAIIAVTLLVFFCTFGQMQRKLNSKRKVERIEREAELNLTVDEKLAKDFTGKIYKQKAFLVYEIVDGLGDIAKPFYYLAASSMARDQPWLLGLLFIVALSATFTSYYSIRTRKKVMSQMNGVVDGDLLHVYAEGVFSEEETGVVGKDNLVMKLDTVNLDLALEEMNQRSVR